MKKNLHGFFLFFEFIHPKKIFIVCLKSWDGCKYDLSSEKTKEKLVVVNLTFSETRAVGNNDINNNFVFPSICSFSLID